MAMVAGVLSLVGGIVSAAGAIEAGNYQAQVANNNAKIADQNAAYSRQAGREAADIKSREGAAKEAAIVTALAANNVDTTGPGSARDVEVGAREVSKLDTKQTYQKEGAIPAYGYTIQAQDDRAQAVQDKLAAGYAAAGDIIGGIGGAIGNFGSQASSFGGFGFGGGGASASSLVSSPAPVSGGVVPLYGGGYNSGLASTSLSGADY
jgi:hypothetical protein